MAKALAATALMLVLASCSRDPAPAPPPARAERIAVTLVAAEPAAGAGALTITGTVRLKRETQLGFNTPGRIAAITAVEGQRVVAGQLLARLDPTGLDAASASAGADATRTGADLRRLETLQAEGWVTRARVESAQAAAVAARSRVAQAGFDARLSRIVAPAAGVILRRAAEPGQMVAAGAPVLTLGEVGSGYVLRVPVSDGDLARFRLGQHAAVTLPALSPDPLAATVGEIAARGDERTGTCQVELRLPPVAGLRSGLIGTARLRTGGQAAPGGALAVPASAVFSARADEGFVYVFQPVTGTVKTRLVHLGDLTDQFITVTDGLRAGEQVVRSGVDRLRDGTAVTVVK